MRQQLIPIMLVFGIALACGTAAQESDPYAQAATWTFEGSRTPLTAIEASTRGASVEQLRQIESKLHGILQAPDATPDAKGWACDMLRQIGTEASVAPVAALLGEKEICVRACNALQSIPSPKVDEALREALPRLAAVEQETVIQTIGARRDAKAVVLLAPLVGNDNEGVANEALFALGHIGTREAADVLKSMKPAETLRSARDQALLECAGGLLAAGQETEAAILFDLVYKKGSHYAVRGAALRGLIRCDPNRATELLMPALQAEDPHLRTAALQALGEMANDDLIVKALDQMKDLTPAQQVVLLDSARGHAVLPAARRALKSDHADLRSAAIRCIARTGTVSEVSILVEAAAGAAGETAEVQNALVALKDPAVDGALVDLLGGDPKQVRLAVAALNGRNARSAAANLIKLAGTCADDGVARELDSALAALAGPEHLKDLVALLMTAPTSAVGNAAAAALTTVGKASGNEDEVCRLLAAELPKASAKVRAAVLGVLPGLGNAQALALVREQLKAAQDAAGHIDAVRCLADWPDATPLDELLALAEETKDVQQNVLALRGVLRMLALPDVRERAEYNEYLKRALAAAQRDEEKRRIEQLLVPGNPSKKRPGSSKK